MRKWLKQVLGDGHVRFWLVAITLLAFALRVVWVWIAPSLDPALVRDPLYGDASGYHVLAANLLAGKGLSWDGQNPTAYRMPGYPLFVAAIYWLGNSQLEPVRFAQALIGALLCVPVFLAARTVSTGNGALLATLGVALWPTLIYLCGWLYSETLFLLILWIGVALFAAAVANRSWRAVVGAGVVLAFATLVRPEIVVWPAFAALIALLARQGTAVFKPALIVQVVLLAVLLPWSLRNTLATGTFVLLTTSGGSNFYAGNNPRSNGGSAWEFPIQGLTELESDRELMRRGWEYLRADPGRSAILLGKKALKFIAPIEMETREGANSVWLTALNIAFAVFLAVALLGWFGLRDMPAATLLFSLVLWYAVTALVFYGGSRVALPVIPVWIIFALHGVGTFLRQRHVFAVVRNVNPGIH